MAHNTELSIAKNHLAINEIWIARFVAAIRAMADKCDISTLPETEQTTVAIAVNPANYSDEWLAENYRGYELGKGDGRD